MTEGDWLGTLTDPEERLWEAFGHGRQVEYWYGEEVRAEVVAALALGAVAGTPGRIAGVRIRGARVVGELDLRHGTIDVPLTMLNCTFTDSVRLEESITKSIDLTGSHLTRLNATGAQIRGSFKLNRVEITDGGEDAALLQLLTVETDLRCTQLRCSGRITLINTRVGSALVLNSAELRYPGDVAINLGGMTVGSSLYFSNGTIEGHLRMPGLYGRRLAQPDRLRTQPPADRGHFAHQSITGDSISAGGDALFDKLTAAGADRPDRC